MMDILLITPPIFASDTFLMANPLLLGVLQKNGLSARHLDLNFDFRQFVGSCLKISKPANFKKHPGPVYSKQLGLRILNDYLRSLPKASYYGISQTNPENSLFQQAEQFHPEVATYHSLLCNNFPKFIELLNDRIHNPFYFFYRRIKIIAAIRVYRTYAVGISLTSPSQFLSALTLAVLLRRYLPHCHIIFGGSYITGYRDEFAYQRTISKLWDNLVMGEGETPLVALLKCLKKTKSADFSGIPNLIYKQKGSFEPKFSNAVTWENIDKLPTPVYPAYSQGNPPALLYIQASRSCYWGKCRYCVHLNNAYPKYRIRNPRLVVEDIASLQKRHQLNSFYFTDTTVSPAMIKQLSDGIISRGLKVRLGCFCRLERGFSSRLLTQAFRAGFNSINFGLETVNPRLASLICKGYNNIEEIDRIIHDAHRAGIIPLVHAIFGLPTEREHETMQTYNFLKERINICQPIIEIFRLEKNTVFFNEHKKFGIEIIRSNDLELFNNSFRYRFSDPRAIGFRKALQIRSRFYREIAAGAGAKGQRLAQQAAELIKTGAVLSKVNFSFGSNKARVSRYILSSIKGDFIILSA